MTMERRSLLRPLLLVVLVFGVIWAAMIWHWRATNRVPSDTDIGLYMVALPIALLLVVLVAFMTVKAVKKRKEAKASQASSEDAEADATPEDDPALGWRLPILAADALLPAGDSPSALLEAAGEGKRVDLHPRLQDAQSAPAFAAEVDDLDTDAVLDGLPETAQDWNPARLRTLALAQMLATRVLETHYDALAPAATETLLTREKPPVLQLEWWLPSSFDEAARKTAGQWMTGQLAANGWKAPQLQLQTRTMTPGGSALKRLDELNKAWNQEALSLPHLLLASDSGIDETIVADWDSRRQLFTSERSEGRSPGEGASAMLIAASGQTRPEAQAWLHRLFSDRRPQPVDQPQRVQSDTLQALADKARKHAELPEDVQLQLIGDTDSRSSRAAEALHLTDAVLPDEDADTVLRQLGVANGDCGTPLTLGLVAVATYLCENPEHAALVFSHYDPSLRLAMLVTPVVDEPEDPET